MPRPVFLAGINETGTSMLGCGGNSLNAEAVPGGEPPRAGGVPCVSILIPVHNRLDLTRACLDTVFDTADPAIPFEIIVIDDCSTDGTAAYLDSLGSRVRAIRNETRKCFAENMNMAASHARSEFLCLLNNDTLLTAGWLAKMLAAARQDPGIAVVGNRQLTAGTNLLDHAGMVFNAQREPVHLYRGLSADFRPALVSREFQCVTAACWLVSRRVFLELGGFDPEFKNSFEDVDFCLRARQNGYKIFYAADSVIVDDPAVKARRLMLCSRTCAVMETGLRLLGIEPVERM